MVKTLEFSAKTVEEATEKALAELQLEREEISVEILERGKSGFLGIGAVDAVVRVTFEGPDEPTLSAEPESAPAPKAAPTSKKESKAKSAPAAPTAPVEPFVRGKGTQEEQTRAFLTGLFAQMGVSADMTITPRQGGGLNVELSGAGIGPIIGRRGETLDAIQHLTNYAVNRSSDRRSHINVDAEGYRAKREDSLVHLAEKMAAKAIKYRRSMALEPMNSYERHIIHSALQDYEGVTTSSTGAEPNRRVVISYVRPETPAAEEEPAEPEYKEWC